LKAILIFALLALATADPLKAKFSQFTRQYGKSYGSADEMERRFQIFKKNIHLASEHQRQNPSARFGITKFMDLEPEEFSRLYKMPKLSQQQRPEKDFNTTEKPSDPVVNCNPTPTTWDWGSCGVVTSVRNQGQCGSCWAFSATETIESYCILAGAQSQFYSVEQIVDCDTAGEDQGCNGGFPEGAYKYIKQAGGIETNHEYPYTAGEGESGSCHFKKADVVCTVTDWTELSGETGIYHQASTNGPVSVCVDASSWQFYNGGILTSCGEDVDHCVQVTGYTKYGSKGAYWHVRNSWGTDWGVTGYIWIEIGKDLCDIGNYATYVDVRVLN